MAKKKPKTRPRTPKPPFDLQRAASVVGPLTDPVEIVARVAGLKRSLQEAALALGVDLDKFLALLERKEYADAWRRGVMVLDTAVCNAVYEAAIAGDTVAQRFWLINRMPDVFTTRGKKPQGEEAGQKQQPTPSPLAGLKIVG